MRKLVMKHIKEIRCATCGSRNIFSEGDYFSYICTTCGRSGNLRTNDKFMQAIMLLKLPCFTLNNNRAYLRNLPVDVEKHEAFTVPMLDESGCFITLHNWEVAGIKYSSLFKFKKEIQRCEREMEDDMLMRVFNIIKNMRNLNDY